MTIVKEFLKFICNASEMLCTLKDNFDILCEMEYKLTGKSCILAEFSGYLDEKYNLEVWGKPEKHYICRECGTIYYHEFFKGRNCNICGIGEIK